MMAMIFRIIVRDDAAGRRADRVQIAAALENGLDVSGRQGAGPALVTDDRASFPREIDDVSSRRRNHRIGRGAGRHAFQTVGTLCTGLQIRQHEPRAPVSFDLQVQPGACGVAQNQGSRHLRQVECDQGVMPVERSGRHHQLGSWLRLRVAGGLRRQDREGQEEKSGSRDSAVEHHSSLEERGAYALGVDGRISYMIS